MKKGIFLLLIPVLFLPLGCKKKNNAPTKVKTITYPLSNEIYTYQYNSDGSLNSIQGSYGDYTTYLYLGGYITVSTYDDNGNITGTTTYFLNSQQLADSISNYSTLIVYCKNTYDGNGYLISQKQYDKNNFLFNTETYTIVNGNMTTARGTGDSTLNTFNNRVNSIGNANTGQTFLGKDSKNLLSSSIATGVGLIDYSYTYDGEGRVSSYTADYVSNATTFTYSYTYY